MKALKVLAVGVVVGGISLAVGTQAHAEAWTPRTVDQIKADIAKTNGKEYTIVWGDTMWGISQATNLTVQKLADMNNIANVDLIYAGNKLVFEGNVVSVENGKGDTVAQTVIQPEDKVDPKKPVGQSVQGKDTTSNKEADNKTDKNAAADSVTKGSVDTKKVDSMNKKNDDSLKGNSTGEYGQLEGFYSKVYVENGWEYVEAGPFESGKDFTNWFKVNYPNVWNKGYQVIGGEFDEKTGDWTNLIAKALLRYVGDSNNNTDSIVTGDNQLQTTPNTPESSNNSGTTTPSQESTTGNQGGNTTPTQPNIGGNTSGTQSGTTQPVQPTQPSQSDSGNVSSDTSSSKFYVGQILYSKEGFKTSSDAQDYINQIWDKWIEYGMENNIGISPSWSGGAGNYKVEVTVTGVNVN